MGKGPDRPRQASTGLACAGAENSGSSGQRFPPCLICASLQASPPALSCMTPVKCFCFLPAFRTARGRRLNGNMLPAAPDLCGLQSLQYLSLADNNISDLAKLDALFYCPNNSPSPNNVPSYCVSTVLTTLCALPRAFCLVSSLSEPLGSARSRFTGCLGSTRPC